MSKYEFRWLERKDGSKELQFRVYQDTMIYASDITPADKASIYQVGLGMYHKYAWSEWITIPTVKE